MSTLLGTEVTAGLSASQLGLESAMVPVVADEVGQEPIDSFEPATATRFSIGFAPLPLSVFANFLLLRERWKNASACANAIADSMPAPKDVGRFEEMTHAEVAQIVRNAAMSDTSLRARAQAFSEQTGVSQFYARISLRYLRYASRELLYQVAHSDNHFRLESLLIDMVVAGEGAALASLVRLFPSEWTIDFLETAARTDPKIHREIVRLSESMFGPENTTGFEGMAYDEVLQIVRNAGMSDANLKALAKTESERTGTNQLRSQIKLRHLRYTSRALLDRVAHSKDCFRLESALVDMVVMGESAAVASLARLFRGEWTTAFLKGAAQTHPNIHQEMVRLSEERPPLFWRISWFLATLSDLPSPFGNLRPESRQSVA